MPFRRRKNIIDRTPRNTNMLTWNKELWLIDHGAALYFHHSWDNWEEQAIKPFAQVKDHVLLSKASELEEVDAEFRNILTPEIIRGIVSLIPEEWIMGEWKDSPELVREIYAQFLETRLANSAIFVKEAQDARESRI